MFTIGIRRPAGTLLLALARLLALCASLAAANAAVSAEKIAASDRAAIEQTIRRQLAAFARDDADGAFHISSPDIQRMFGSSDNFMEMVREHYEPVYRPGDVRFVGIQMVGRQWVQTVQLVDGDGKVWRALFTMKRQPDGSWRVGGCQLVQTSAIAT